MTGSDGAHVHSKISSRLAIFNKLPIETLQLQVVVYVSIQKLIQTSPILVKTKDSYFLFHFFHF